MQARGTNEAGAIKHQRRAIYTRVSTDNGLEQEFNSLHAQREAAQAYVKSQAHEGWRLIRDHYDDGGFSGGSLDRPGLQKLLADIRARRIDNVVVYKVDSLTRSLTDFAKLVELFDAQSVAFVSVTQSFNTTTSMGRLTLNVLLLATSQTGGRGLRREPGVAHLRALNCLSVPDRTATITAIAGMTGLESKRSPPQTEPVSSKYYATRRGKGILRLETGGERRRLSPKISVSPGLPLHSARKRRACRDIT
jgi:hypothetical protein